MDVQTISVRLPVDLYEKLRQTAFERRESMNSLIVEGVGLRLADLSNFRVAGFNDETMAFTEPVEVRCGRCGAAKTFTYRDDGGADYTESLAVLVDWARGHRCKDEGSEEPQP